MARQQALIQHPFALFDSRVERLRENLADFAEKLSEIEKFVPGRDL